MSLPAEEIKNLEGELLELSLHVSLSRCVLHIHSFVLENKKSYPTRLQISFFS